jgi:hypothetical protein
VSRDHFVQNGEESNVSAIRYNSSTYILVRLVGI